MGRKKEFLKFSPDIKKMGAHIEKLRAEGDEEGAEFMLRQTKHFGEMVPALKKANKEVNDYLNGALELDNKDATKEEAQVYSEAFCQRIVDMVGEEAWAFGQIMQHVNTVTTDLEKKTGKNAPVAYIAVFIGEYLKHHRNQPKKTTTKKKEKK